MSAQKIFSALLSAAGLIIFILDGKTALIGASEGITLCLNTLIPSLFPFLFFCSILTNALWGEQFRWIASITHRLGIPHGGESLLISALLGGYPAGALAIGKAFDENRLTKNDACHLLTFCNNAGPAFLFGMAIHLFPNHSSVWMLWIIQTVSSAITGIMGHYHPIEKSTFSKKSNSISQILEKTVYTMSLICGWVLLFQIVSKFLNRWILWYFPKSIQIIITGLLEISSGFCLLTDISSIPARFLVCTCFLSFGGLCVTMQTASVIGALPLKYYLKGKLMHFTISMLIAFFYLKLGWIFPVIITILTFGFLIYPKKEVDFCQYPMYNDSIIMWRKQNNAVSQKN